MTKDLHKDIKYVATLPHVREVTLVGSADLGFWTDRLRAENLTPLAHDGRARILAISADSRFRGVSFQELSFSIVLAPGSRLAQQLGPGAFLAQAFNSVRFFAFCERTFFGTPYEYGSLRIEASLPASVHLARKQFLLFRAEMGAGAAPSAEVPYRDGWEGPILLPSRGEKGRGRWFVARIRGAALPVTFQPGRDSIEIRASSELPIFQDLIDSGFTATHWLVRPDAMHAKSKTYSDRD